MFGHRIDCLMLWVLLLCWPSFLAADVIHLKNGREIAVDMAWEENGFVYGEKLGATLKFSLDAVEKIARPGSKPKRTPRPRFGFGPWNIGHTDMQLIDLAQRENILFLPGGLGGERETPVPATRERLLTAPYFYYHDLLWSRKASIRLHLTQASRRLHRIAVVFRGADIDRDSSFRSEVQQMLSAKYGNPASGAGLELLVRDVVWNLKYNYRVVLKVEKGELTILYMDLKVAK